MQSKVLGPGFTLDDNRIGREDGLDEIFRSSRKLITSSGTGNAPPIGGDSPFGDLAYGAFNHSQRGSKTQRASDGDKTNPSRQSRAFQSYLNGHTLFIPNRRRKCRIIECW